MRIHSLMTATVLSLAVAGGAWAQDQQNNTSGGAPSAQGRAASQDPSANRRAAQDNRSTDRTAADKDNSGEKRGLFGLGGSDANDIRWSIARVADNALTKDGLDNVVMRLVDADRNRIDKWDMTDDQRKKLDGRVEQIRQAWKAKYGEDFRARRYRNFLALSKVEEGEIGRDAQLASEVRKNSETAAETSPAQNDKRDSGNVTGDRQNDVSPGGARTTGNNDQTVTGRQKDRYGNTESDQNLDEGRNIAVITIPGSGGKSDLRVPMIHEFPDSWKVNIPDRVTGQQLYDNLLKQLTAVGESSSQWPSNADEAYRLVTYHVLSGLLDTENSGTGLNPRRESSPAADSGRVTPQDNTRMNPPRN